MAANVIAPSLPSVDFKRQVSLPRERPTNAPTRGRSLSDAFTPLHPIIVRDVTISRTHSLFQAVYFIKAIRGHSIFPSIICFVVWFYTLLAQFSPQSYARIRAPILLLAATVACAWPEPESTRSLNGLFTWGLAPYIFAGIYPMHTTGWAVGMIVTQYLPVVTILRFELPPTLSFVSRSLVWIASYIFCIILPYLWSRYFFRLASRTGSDRALGGGTLWSILNEVETFDTSIGLKAPIPEPTAIEAVRKYHFDETFDHDHQDEEEEGKRGGIKVDQREEEDGLEDFVKPALVKPPTHSRSTSNVPERERIPITMPPIITTSVGQIKLQGIDFMTAEQLNQVEHYVEGLRGVSSRDAQVMQVRWFRGCVLLDIHRRGPVEQNEVDRVRGMSPTLQPSADPVLDETAVLPPRPQLETDVRTVIRPSGLDVVYRNDAAAATAVAHGSNATMPLQTQAALQAAMASTSTDASLQQQLLTNFPHNLVPHVTSMSKVEIGAFDGVLRVRPTALFSHGGDTAHRLVVALELRVTGSNVALLRRPELLRPLFWCAALGRPVRMFACSEAEVEGCRARWRVELEDLPCPSVLDASIGVLGEEENASWLRSRASTPPGNAFSSMAPTPTATTPTRNGTELLQRQRSGISRLSGAVSKLLTPQKAAQAEEEEETRFHSLASQHVARVLPCPSLVPILPSEALRREVIALPEVHDTLTLLINLSHKQRRADPYYIESAERIMAFARQEELYVLHDFLRDYILPRIAPFAPRSLLDKWLGRDLVFDSSLRFARSMLVPDASLVILSGIFYLGGVYGVIYRNTILAGFHPSPTCLLTTLHMTMYVSYLMMLAFDSARFVRHRLVWISILRAGLVSQEFFVINTLCEPAPMLSDAENWVKFLVITFIATLGHCVMTYNLRLTPLLEMLSSTVAGLSLGMYALLWASVAPRLALPLAVLHFMQPVIQQGLYRYISLRKMRKMYNAQPLKRVVSDVRSPVGGKSS